MENLSEAITRIKTWFYRQLEFLKCNPSESHRLIILLSIIDSFAQENSGFSRKNQKAFVDFIQTYGVQYTDILQTLCPVTLYYSQFDNREDVSLQLQQGVIYTAGSTRAALEAQRLLELLPDNRRENLRLKHSYAGLVYQLRNKLSHEFMSLNMPLNFLFDKGEQLPHMACENKVENNELVFYRWALHIPEAFVKSVAIDAVEHYLEDCVSRNYIPFSQMDRKCYNSWYD